MFRTPTSGALSLASLLAAFWLPACSADQSGEAAQTVAAYDAPVSGQGCEVIQLSDMTDRLGSLPGITAEMDLTAFQMQLDDGEEYIISEYGEDKYVLRTTRPVRIQSDEGSVSITCVPQ